MVKLFGGGGARRKIALAAGVAFDLGLLGYYKYAGLIVAALHAVVGFDFFHALDISLPVGVSFFIFQEISYLADVYKGEAQASPKLVNTALYISFFPQLIAGPIVKYRDINAQIVSRRITADGVASGFKRFIYGLSKKVLISNVLGLCADTVYAYDIALIDGKTAWIGALAYTFQIYYDFSGYSDMAIGLGEMFGFQIPENFNYPYLSNSVTEFWRRWHISLGSWFKEYVYIPLGGNRKGNVRTYINLLIIFFLTGLWHGAHALFILWGFYCGFFIIVERIGFKKILDRSNCLSVAYTFLIVNFGWVLFRAGNTLTALRYIARMLLPWRHPDLNIQIWNYMDRKTVFIGVCAVLGAGFLKAAVPERLSARWRDSVLEALCCAALLVLCLAAVASDTYNPFIYFQF